MKRIILLTLLIAAGTMIIWSQVPQAMNYKAVAKDDWGVALPNKTITLRFTILQGGATGSIVYQETHTTITNKFGLMDVEIGKGIPSSVNTFDDIDWSTGVYYIQIEMDPNGGTNFRLEDPAHQLLSVPYALYARSSGNSVFSETDPVFASSPSSSILSNEIYNWNTAFNWGNHANEGYLKSFTESDPIFLLHPAHGIASDNISNWNAAYGWGNHAGLYKPIEYAPEWNEVTGKPVFAPVALSGSYNDLTSKPVGTSIGDIQYWSGTEWTILTPGTDGQVLRLINGIPSWGSSSNEDEGLLIGDPSPYNGEGVVSNNLVLKCTVVDPDMRPLFFDVYLAGPSGTVQVGSNLITPLVKVTLHEPGSYSWRICVKDDLGHTTWGELWLFDVGYDPMDRDSDWYTYDQGDCNDLNPEIHPGAIEICGDGIDQDCNGIDLVCPNDPDNNVETVTDWDGNVYHAVTIGAQTWTKENLRTTHYNDGTVIRLITDANEWMHTQYPAYCWYNNDEANYKPTYGAIYNWYTVSYNDNGGKNICPIGWHVPSDNAWINLENYLIGNGFNYDGTTTGNKIAKSLADNTRWQSSTVIGAIGNSDFSEMMNASGFSAGPAGIRSMGGDYSAIGFATGFWTSSVGTENPTGAVFIRQLLWERSSIERLENGKNYGFSVRCIKD